VAQVGRGLSETALVVWLAVAAMCAWTACSPAKLPGPDVAVLQWLNAFAAQDGNTVARLTCRAAQADVQNGRLLSMALGVVAPNYGAGGGGQPVYDVSDLQYATTFADDTRASVQVTGLLHVATGVSKQVLTMNTTVSLIREDRQWRLCDTRASATSPEMD
jgi:hypothetical protein